MKQYIVDAFTDKVFAGNPAAICILEKWLTDELMISITTENNLSETAFAVKEPRTVIVYAGLRRAVKLIYAVMQPLPVLMCSFGSTKKEQTKSHFTH